MESFILKLRTFLKLILVHLNYCRVELTNYASVLDAQVSGDSLSAAIDFSQCVDPTGQVDLSGMTAGAYFQSATILGVGSE